MATGTLPHALHCVCCSKSIIGGHADPQHNPPPHPTPKKRGGGGRERERERERNKIQVTSNATMTVLKQNLTFVPPPSSSFFFYSCTALTMTTSDVVRSYNEPWPKKKRTGGEKKERLALPVGNAHACSPCSGAPC